MKHTYTNRYRDAIEFERTDDNTVVMRGAQHFRYGFPNKYDRAYKAYMKVVKELEEPDYNLLVEDVDANAVRSFTEAEFEKAMQGNLHDYEDKIANPTLKSLWKHVYSDKDTIDMVDPSGGPYLTLGVDLQTRVGFPESFVIKSIKFGDSNEGVIFKNTI
jgi:hypothetical protein